jgi:hypothetical protein
MIRGVPHLPSRKLVFEIIIQVVYIPVWNKAHEWKFRSPHNNSNIIGL